AEFIVPNPTPGPHPTWHGVKLPSTKRDGELSVSLTRLTVGSIRPGWLPVTLRGVPWTNASFRISEKGKPTGDWAPVGMTISDATGNILVPPGMWHQQGEGRARFSFYGRRLPEEQAWKLRVEFARTAHFAPADLWTVRGLAVRGGRVTAATSRHGVRLRAILRA